MDDREWGPEEDQWDLEVENEYIEYKQKMCTCSVNEDCECISLEAFRNQKIKDLESYWDWREESVSFEEDYA